MYDNFLIVVWKNCAELVVAMTLHAALICQTPFSLDPEPITLMLDQDFTVYWEWTPEPIP
jgi:hypothetical protein